MRSKSISKHWILPLSYLKSPSAPPFSVGRSRSFSWPSGLPWLACYWTTNLISYYSPLISLSPPTLFSPACQLLYCFLFLSGSPLFVLPWILSPGLNSLPAVFNAVVWFFFLMQIWPCHFSAQNALVACFHPDKRFWNLIDSNYTSYSYRSVSPPTPSPSQDSNRQQF